MTDTGRHGVSGYLEPAQLAWIDLRIHERLTIPEAAKRLGVDRSTGDRYERRWRAVHALVAECVQKPQPDGTCGYWVAYPNSGTIIELVHVEDRVALAWGKGPSRSAALEAARQNGPPRRDYSLLTTRFGDIGFRSLGIFAPWDLADPGLPGLGKLPLVPRAGCHRHHRSGGRRGYRRASHCRAGRAERQDSGDEDCSLDTHVPSAVVGGGPPPGT